MGFPPLRARIDDYGAGTRKYRRGKLLERFSIARIMQKRQTELRMSATMGEVRSQSRFSLGIDTNLATTVKFAVEVSREYCVNGAAMHMPRFPMSVIYVRMHVKQRGRKHP